MAMSPQNDPITGATVLRSPAIQSPGFVSGSTGWIIRIDGTAEFNTGIFRGSIEVGPNPGQHFIVNNPDTGDALDIYDAFNDLVLSIDDVGDIKLFDPASERQLIESGGRLDFQTVDTGSVSHGRATIQYVGSTGASDSSYLSVTTVNGAETVAYELRILPGSNDGTVKKTALGDERGVVGSLVQSDQQSTNNLMHVLKATIATDGSGNFNQAHGASFTPNLRSIGNVASTGSTAMINFTSFTATNMLGTMFGSNNGLALPGQNLPFNCILFG